MKNYCYQLYKVNEDGSKTSWCPMGKEQLRSMFPTATEYEFDCFMQGDYELSCNGEWFSL